MQFPVDIIIAVFGSVMASTGFWTWISGRNAKSKALEKMVLGLGHDRIMYLCETYIKQEYVTKSQLENLHDYLYEPYHEMGGNGSAKSMMEAVSRLPIKSDDVMGK